MNNFNSFSNNSENSSEIFNNPENSSEIFNNSEEFPKELQVFSEIFPEFVDFKENTETTTKVDNQLSQGSCVAHATQTALEVAFNRAGLPEDFSRAYLYYFLQEAAGTLGTIDGSYPKDIGSILNKFGCCAEELFPYIESKYGVRPSAELVALGKQKVHSVELSRVLGYKEILRRICAGKPVIVGFGLTNEFFGLKGDWRKHSWLSFMPIVGYHAVCIIGYDLVSRRFLVENSWGSSWGDGGFFGMPFEIANNAECYCIDKLSVDYKAVQGYKAESNSIFKADTQELLIADLDFYPGNFVKPIEQKLVKVKVLSEGKLTADALVVPSNYFLYKQGNVNDWVLGLKSLDVYSQGKLVANYKNVQQVGARYELLA
jgi:hypothetical protein